MEVLERGLIWDQNTAVDGRQAATFVALHASAAGALYASFRRGAAKDSSDGDLTLCQSVDCGRTWEVICDSLPERPAGCQGQWVTGALYDDPAGGLGVFMTLFETREEARLYDGDSDSLLPSWLVQATSGDGGRTWRDYRVVDTGSLPGCSGTGSAVALADGTVLLPFESYGFLPGGEYRTHRACSLRLPGDDIVVHASDPRGERYFWDQRVAWCPHRQRPVAMFWTYDRQGEHDLPIHLSWGSADGRTWEAPRPTPLQGQICAPVPLRDGRLAAFYVQRETDPGLRLVLSDDAGATWDTAGEVVIYEAAAAGQVGEPGGAGYAEYWDEMFTWTFGHPTGLQLPDGNLLLAFYAGSSPRSLAIHRVIVGV